jgi:hypothetical protein
LGRAKEPTFYGRLDTLLMMRKIFGSAANENSRLWAWICGWRNAIRPRSSSVNRPWIPKSPGIVICIWMAFGGDDVLSHSSQELKLALL